LQEPATEPTTDKINEVTKEDRRRRNRGGLPTDRDTTQKLMFAMAVVRVLAGGSDGKLIDWPIVGLIFPGYPIKAISDRGRTILNRHRHVIAKIQLDFQERFADAYERDEIPLPPIDYDNLEAYDWQKIVEWAEEQIDKPKVDRTPSLPATRAQFDSVFELRTERSRNVDDIYQQGLNFTTPKTQTLLSSAPFGIPLGQGPSKEDKSARDQYLDQLSIVKSWVRANIVTPEESYRSADARQTLERFGEALIDQAIQSLVTEQAIMMGNRGRITPGRNFDITDQFIGALARRRHIETTQLRRAAHFKLNVLDPAFRSDGKYTVQQNAEDGDVMAILSLMERGRIVMCPVDPPRNRFGLVHRGYLTRLMDKTKLKFAIEVKPVEEEENYIYSDPMQEAVTNTPVPRGEVDVDEHLPNSPGLGRIPLWFDVHRQFVKVLWDTIMAAVLGYVALRPGISAEGVARGLQPCITAWEADLILRWLGDVGATQRVRDVDNYPSGVAVGWRVKEWWWMTLK
jgi:transcription factor C subunit 3